METAALCQIPACGWTLTHLAPPKQRAQQNVDPMRCLAGEVKITKAAPCLTCACHPREPLKDVLLNAQPLPVEEMRCHVKTCPPMGVHQKDIVCHLKQHQNAMLTVLYIVVQRKCIVPAKKTTWAVQCQIRAYHLKMETALLSALSIVTKMK